jgi:membrane protease YdiL (CAAX protease family)
MRPSLALIVTGFVVIWLALDRSAFLLGSFLGEYGLLVCAITLAVALAVETAISRRRPLATLSALGLKAPNQASLVAALGLAALILAFLPLNAWRTGTAIDVKPGWLWLALGMFAQGGVAEEVLFRGYLFRHMRARWSFWRAAWVAAIPFVAVHLLLFATLDPGLAAASIGLSLAVSFPFAWLYERSENSIWPPAILHAATQAGIKLVIVPDDALPSLAFGWMALTAVVPWLVFLLRPDAPTAHGSGVAR